MTTVTAPDYDAIKTRQQGTWSSGDYAVIGTTLQIVGETLCEAVDIAAGEDVLDVAAGNGNASLAAARRGAIVTASDYVPALLKGTLARAAAEGLTIDAQEADAEALPFADDSFDAVLSTFGVMFTPNQDAVRGRARARVPSRWPHRPRRTGRPTASSGRCSRSSGATSRRRPASTRRSSGAPRLASPSCSDANVLDSCRCTARSSSSATARPRTGSTRSASSTGRRYKAFGALDAAAQSGLEQDLLMLAREHNTERPWAAQCRATYAEVVATV